MKNLSSAQESLELRQIPIYLAAMLAGLLVGNWLPDLILADAVLNPALALMMFATFLQMPLARLPQALRHGRFLAAMLLANFVFIPLLVYLLLPLAPADATLRFAIVLVLLAPCIDYVVVFSHLGKADARLLLAATPMLLLIQMAAVPLLLHYVFDTGFTSWPDPAPVVHAFLWIVALPLLAAGVVQFLQKRSGLLHRAANGLALLPVPATALVLFIVLVMAVTQASVPAALAWPAALIYVVYALLAPLAGWAAARLLCLPGKQKRAIAFSAATRNSLVVLPVAIAIPQAGALIASVIVIQTLVELISELFYIRWIPRLIRTEDRQGATSKSL